MSVATSTVPPIAAPPPSDALNKRKRKREKEKANKKANQDEKAAKEVAAPEGDAVIKKPKTVEQEKADTKASVGGAPKRARGKQIAKRKARAAAEAGIEPSTNGAGKAKGEPKKPLVETLNRDMAMMDPKLLADYFVQKLKWFDKDLSSVELEDKRIPESAFLDTTSFTEERYLKELPKFLEAFHKSTPLADIPLDSASPTPGTPHTLVLTSSAIRATHVIRALRSLQTSKDITIAKLFAKHIKLSESITLCNTTRINIGVGTPARMLELMKEGALKLNGCVRLVLDMSAVNEKKQGLLDVKDTQKGVVDFVNEETVKQRLGSGEMKVLVF